MLIKILARFFRTVSLLTLLLALSACNKSTNISTDGAGHAISAALEGTHSIDTKGDRAVITCDFGKIIIEPASCGSEIVLGPKSPNGPRFRWVSLNTSVG